MMGRPFDRNRLRINKRRKEFPEEKGTLYDVHYLGHRGFVQKWPDASDWFVSLQGEGRGIRRDAIPTLEEANEVVIEILREIYGDEREK